jgi:hypothetical protein
VKNYNLFHAVHLLRSYEQLAYGYFQVEKRSQPEEGVSFSLSAVARTLRVDFDHSTV